MREAYHDQLDSIFRDLSVVCGNVQTANATVYVVDQVLMPKM